MQFIVSAIPEDEENLEEYNNIFTIHQKYHLKRIRVKYDYELYPTLNTTLRFLLPYELVEKCLNYVLDLYLRSRSYIFAIDLLQINSDFQTKFYKKYFTTISNRYGVTNRLYSLFHCLHDIWNILQEYNDCTCMEIKTSKYQNCNNFFIWNYDEEHMEPGSYEQTPLLVQNHFTPQMIQSITIQNGPFSTDKVLLANYTFRKGIYTADYYRTPLIYLRFIDIVNEETILPHLEMVSTKEWISFGKLIRLGFGQQTGVFVEVRTNDIGQPCVVIEI